MIDLAYSGNRGQHFAAGGYDLNSLDPKYLALGQGLNSQVPNPNAGKIPGSLGAATISRNQSLRDYPQYTSINVASPRLGSFTSNLFIASVEKRMSHGLSVLVSYTGGKVISDSLATPVNFGPIEQANEIGWQNGRYNRQINRSVDPDDVSSRAVVSVLYELPFGRGHRYGGWQVNTIGAMQKGLPLILRGASNFLSDRPNSTGKSAKLDNPTRDGWFDTNQFINPPDFTYGNIGRVLPDVRTPGTVNWDFL